MLRLAQRCRDVIALLFLVLSWETVAPWNFVSKAGAKTPGEIHCYKKICHRVKTIVEVRRLVGQTLKITATHYDHPSVDRYNTGKYTSSGEVFNARDATRASSSNLPDGTEIVVWNRENGKTAHLRINDFGPFHSDRKLDLTRAAAEKLGFARKGVTELDVIVVAPPPAGEPKYKRGRRYPAALGYIGVLSPNQFYSLADSIAASRQLNRMASIDIQQYLWTVQLQELDGGQVIANETPDVSNVLLASREALGILPYAKASRDTIFPTPQVLPALTYAPQPQTPMIPRRHASTSDVPNIKPTSRPATPFDLGPARFGLKLGADELAGWRARPSLRTSRNTNYAQTSMTARVAARNTAPIYTHKTRAFEVATADVDSVRWLVPGLDKFMRLMTPFWGTGVTPPQALQVAMAMSFALITAALLLLDRMVPVAPVVPRSSPARAPAAPFAWFNSASRSGVQLPFVKRAKRNDRDWRAPQPQPLLLRTTPRPSVIARGLRVDGPVNSKGTVIVSGEVIGDCRCHTLIIQSSGRVVGKIEAARVEIRGRFSGVIDAASLIIEDGAIIEHDIALKTIVNDDIVQRGPSHFALAAE